MIRRVPGSARCLGRRKNCAEAFYLHHGQRKSSAGGRRRDRLEGGGVGNQQSEGGRGVICETAADVDSCGSVGGSV